MWFQATKLMHNILLKCTENLKVLPIYRDPEKKELYLERYHLGFLFGWRFYIHHFIDSDPVGLHNHPWKYGFSFLLCGRYREETRFGLQIINWFNVVNGDKFHRTALNEYDPEPVWSLFVHSPKCGNWGFLWTREVFYDDPYDKLPAIRVRKYETIYTEVGSGAGTSVWHLNPNCLTGKELRKSYELKNS